MIYVYGCMSGVTTHPSDCNPFIGWEPHCSTYRYVYTEQYDSDSDIGGTQKKTEYSKNNHTLFFVNSFMQENMKKWKPLIKICWTRLYMHVLEQVDYVWYICTSWYSRSVDAKTVGKISYTTAKKVWVFVNETSEQIDNYCRVANIHIIQLHGKETREQCNQLKHMWYTVRKALPAENWRKSHEYTWSVDLFIFDSKTPGSGIGYDYSILNNVSVPFLVAWWLTPENAYKVVNILPNCLGVDISSGVETDGEKNEKKIMKIVNTRK